MRLERSFFTRSFFGSTIAIFITLVSLNFNYIFLAQDAQPISYALLCPENIQTTASTNTKIDELHFGQTSKFFSSSGRYRTFSRSDTFSKDLQAQCLLI